MRSSNVVWTLLLVVLVWGLFLVRRCREPAPREPFRRQPAQLAYAPLLPCRLDCRGIHPADVELVMRRGVLLLGRRYRRNGACPVFTLQGVDRAGTTLRIVLEQCADQTLVIDSYHPKKAPDCNCP